MPPPRLVPRAPGGRGGFVRRFCTGQNGTGRRLGSSGDFARGKMARAAGWPGRPGWLPTQAPHRSGRAEFQHPVPHLMSSLPARSGAVALTDSRSRCTSPVSLPRVMRRCPLPSPGSLRLVPLAQRYYEALRLPAARLAALRFLRLAIPTWCPRFVPAARDGNCGSAWSLVSRAPAGIGRWNRQGLPSSRETLMTIRPALRPRRVRIRGRGPIVNVSDTAPAPNQNEGSPHCEFRGSITRLLASLSTPRGGGYPPLHARLASGCWPQLCRAGFEPAGFLRKVSECHHSSSSHELTWR